MTFIFDASVPSTPSGFRQGLVIAVATIDAMIPNLNAVISERAESRALIVGVVHANWVFVAAA